MNWQILDKDTIWELLQSQDDRIGYANAFVTLLGGYNVVEATLWWVATAYYSRYVRVVGSSGDLRDGDPSRRDVAVCPACPFDDILNVCESAANVKVGEFFESNLEYPQNPVSSELERELERDYKTLKRTGRTYTVDSITPQWEAKYYTKGFAPVVLEEVEYKDGCYVRMKALLYSDNKIIRFDGKDKKIEHGEYYFVEVARVHFKRFCDKSGKEWALPCSKEGRLMPLFAGVQVDLQVDWDKHNYNNGEKIDMSKHGIGRYIQNHFAKDIEQVLDFAPDKGVMSLVSAQHVRQIIASEIEQSLRIVLKKEIEQSIRSVAKDMEYSLRTGLKKDIEQNLRAVGREIEQSLRQHLRNR